MSNKCIGDRPMPDPWMVAANGVFYLTFTLGNRISIWESPLMEDFSNPRRAGVWQPKKGSPWSAKIWAPELHLLDGTWYIYATAAHPEVGNKGHRTIVLRSRSQDPLEKSAWEFLGPVKGMPDRFSIDATVFSPNSRDLYMCWSGWPPEDASDSEQNLYVTRMMSPEQVVPESELPPVCISRAELPWERFNKGRRGINEGPTWVKLSNGEFAGIVYSANAAFQSNYKLGLLRLVAPDADPLNSRSWKKRSTPLLVGDQKMPGPYAPGHASFMASPYPGDDKVFCIYHGTDNWGEGFRNRKARILTMSSDMFRDDAPTVCCSNAPHNPLWARQLSGRPTDLLRRRRPILDRTPQVRLRGCKRFSEN